MKKWTDEELVKLAKKKIDLNKLKDKQVILHPEISKWRSPEKPDLLLLKSLNDRGQIHAVTFRDLGEKGIQLLAGARRYAHMKLLKWTWDEIDTDVREKVSNREALILALEENLVRKDMTPMEQARAINSMLKMRMPMKVVTEIFDKGEGWVRSRKTLFELPKKVRDVFDEKDLDFGYSIPLRKLKGLEEAQMALIEEIVKGKEDGRYYGIDTIEKADEFVTRILKQVKDKEALLAKYGPCPKCGDGTNIHEAFGEDHLLCGECRHAWHGVTKEPWEFFELKQQAREMGFEIEEGAKLKFTPQQIAQMVADKAAEEEAEAGEATEEETLDKNFRSKATLLMLLEPLLKGDNIQKLQIHGENVEIQLIEGHEPGLHFKGLRKDYVDGVNKARIETLTSWGSDDVVKDTHDYVNKISA
ncbi:hypothetical protein LCGC14_1443600 [marine sediment metagenome]|uniref:ParB/Sulfiredoxin domain-containing protein n=1 Tax=marine sediment metagenome TaxID=412755 RepID=A0A0F9K647_9ZZZZ